MAVHGHPHPRLPLSVTHTRPAGLTARLQTLRTPTTQVDQTFVPAMQSRQDRTQACEHLMDMMDRMIRIVQAICGTRSSQNISVKDLNL